MNSDSTFLLKEIEASFTVLESFFSRPPITGLAASTIPLDAGLMLAAMARESSRLSSIVEQLLHAGSLIVAACSAKDIVVIGSGATAVSIVPAVAEKARHVTMLQRSPTYIIPQSKSNLFAIAFFAIFPTWLAYWLAQMYWIMQYQVSILMCRAFPGLVREAIRYTNKRLLAPDYPLDLHFRPRYNPWEQRICASVDGDCSLRFVPARLVS